MLATLCLLFGKASIICSMLAYPQRARIGFMDESDRSGIAAQGGRARAAKLSSEERSAIAKEAAQKRWAEAKQEAQEQGPHRVLESFKSVLNLAGMKLPC